MDLRKLEDIYHVLRLVQAQSNMEVFLYWVLDTLCDLTGVDRSAYLRYDANLQSWILGAQKVIAGLSQMPGGYVFHDMPTIQEAKKHLNRWMFTPRENIGFDAIYFFEVNNGKGPFVVALAIDDLENARRFSFKEKQELERIAHILRDMIVLKKENLKLAHAAGRIYVDEFLGIKNRRALHERLEQLSKESPKYLSLAIFDLDKFKMINDTFGHEMGDQVLLAFANILKQFPDHEFYRTGGDEFAGLIWSENPEAVLKEILRRFNAVSLVTWKLSFSCGFADFFREEPRLSWRAADFAVYQVKKNGRNDIRGIQVPYGVPYLDIVGKKLEEIAYLFI